MEAVEGSPGKARRRKKAGSAADDAPELTQPLFEAQARALVALGQHRVHTTAQLHQLIAPELSERWVRELMNRAAKAELVKAVRQRRVASAHGSAPNLWILTEKGAQVISGHPEFREVAPFVSDAETVLARGERHVLGVNEFGILLTRLFGERDYAVSWRNEVNHWLVARPRPRRNDPRFRTDAVIQLDYASQGKLRTHRVMYEYDRCTEPKDVVEGQMEAMLRYLELEDEAGKPVWQRSYPKIAGQLHQGFPTVVWNFSGRHEDLRAAAFVEELSSRGSRLNRGSGKIRVLVTTGKRLAAEGPLSRLCFLSAYDGGYVNLFGQKAREGVEMAAGSGHDSGDGGEGPELDLSA